MNIVIVDAFTNKPFSGNQAAVVVLKNPESEQFMQQVANEMNLSETAFLYPIGEVYNLRWFTPQLEVNLCGHATLASAHVLFSEGYISPDKVAVFETLSGKLTASKKGEWIELDFPAIPTDIAPIPDYLKNALGVEIINLNSNPSGYSIAQVATEQDVRSLNPDFRLLKQANAIVIVTTKSETPEYDFISRVFGPAYGIDEDPVTGAAHCALATYWSGKLNKTEFTAYQASKRGGILKLKIEGERVKLVGQAVTVLKGEIFG